MKITALEEYGLRCMMQLALCASDRPMTVAQVAEREGLSTEYAGKLLNLLSQAELVRSVRGRNGGFLLTRRADKISLADIITALSKDLFDSEYCEHHSGAEDICVHQTSCALRPVWAMISAMIRQVLENFSLMDLLQTEAQVVGELQPYLDSLPERISATRAGSGLPLHQVHVPAASAGGQHAPESMPTETPRTRLGEYEA